MAEVTSAELYEAYSIARTLGGQPIEEALMEVADHYHMDQDDVLEMIDEYLEAKGKRTLSDRLDY